MKKTNVAWRLSSCGQLALLIEASAPKPGNVNRIQSFSDTQYRHFLSSAAQAGKGFFRGAQVGISIAEGNLRYDEANLGELILSSEKEILGGFVGRNTIFGSVLLLIPLTVAIGATIFEKRIMEPKLVKRHVRNLVEETTVNDALTFSQAFQILDLENHENKKGRGWKIIHDRYDITSPHIENNIREDHLTLTELFEISAPVDPLCREISEAYPLVLERLYPQLLKKAEEIDSIEEAVVKVFIWLLSQKLDGHILRRNGKKMAELVQENAKKTLLKYDLDQRLDEATTYLEKNIPDEINPGTTADFMAAAIMCWLVDREFN
ncbi:MAG: hypothetical protein GF309_08550 [Candidatus Lokiarchaeota archaeon]|nr:hypothetical protein [Candidatus Lokiarchaeota archaeon]